MAIRPTWQHGKGGGNDNSTRRDQFTRNAEEESELDGIEYDEEDGHTISADEVIGLLRNIEQYRQALTRESATLERWLAGSQELQDTWREFQLAGGVSADDFQAFIDGTFRYRRIKQKRHLRLVSTGKNVITHRAQRMGGDDAA